MCQNSAEMPTTKVINPRAEEGKKKEEESGGRKGGQG